MTMIRKSALALAAGLFACAAHATEGGAPIVPFGVMEFGAGQLPPPSEYGAVGLRVAAYSANKLRDGSGNLSPVKPDLNVESAGLAWLKMTDITFGDFRYGFGAVLPWLSTSVDLTIPTPGGPIGLSGRNRAQGDLQIVPAILQWNPMPGLYTNAQLALQFATGSYDKNRLINAGANHRTVIPSVGLTWISPSGLEVSSNIQLNIHSRNKATDYKSGTEYQHEFSIGQHIGSWTVGMGGYHIQQVSDDKAAGLTDGNRVRVTALGPVVHFFELGSGWPLVWAHAYREFNVRNRSQGTQFTVRAAWTF